MTIKFQRNPRQAKNNFFKKVRVTHHFFGNFMLNSNLKSAFENAKNFIFDEFCSSRFSKVLLIFEFPIKLSRT